MNGPPADEIVIGGWPIPEGLARRAPGRVGRRRVVGVVTLLAVGYALVVGNRWIRHDAVFGPVGWDISMAVAVDQQVDVNVQPYQRAPVTLVSARPNVLENTSHAEISVVLCVPIHEVMGASRGPLGAWCDPVGDVRDQLLEPDDGQPYLILVVTPRQAGVVHVAGIELTYRDGLRRGHQLVGVDTQVTAPEDRQPGAAVVRLP
jgi:hypothetical protein